MARPKPTGFPPDSEELPSPVVDNHTHFPLRPEDMPPGVDPLSTDLALERAAASGVIAAIHSACELPDLAPSVELAREHAAISLALAIHPNEATRHAPPVERALLRRSSVNHAPGAAPRAPAPAPGRDRTHP